CLPGVERPAHARDREAADRRRGDRAGRHGRRRRQDGLLQPEPCVKTLPGRAHHRGRFRLEVVLIVAFLDFATLVGLYVISFALELIDLEGAAASARETFIAASEWVMETLMLPMLAVSGLTWYG